MDRLPFDVLVQIFAELGPSECLRVSQCCSGWRSVALCNQVFAVGRFLARPFGRSNMLLPAMGRLKLADWISVPYAFIFPELFPAAKLAEKAFDRLICRSLADSSHDHASQTIAETLSFDRQSFWSSSGSDSPESDEFLLYELVAPFCLVSRIEITPFKAIYQLGAPVYPPKTLVVEISFGDNPPHYISPEFEMTAKSGMMIPFRRLHP